ncbi:hypothetical protein EJD97_000698 [Solanum chilense]|uniref:Uncharacterized protein n=1 Tax=Solanum chilense TaxID=4083 RepID=A0A6N2AMV5_SOLCI|nr:hypothetical protein EJD97_000698 [Solanum chilense]
MVSIIEQCQVAPPTCAIDKLTLPLTCFDTLWILHNHHIPRILFYKLQNIDKNSFIQNIIPTLKHSLSLTLKHYLPLAGNLVCPWNSTGYPELRYVAGDSVSVTFSETDMDFDYLVSYDHIHNAKDFHPFVPKMAEPKDASGVQFTPVLAIQVTLFPNHGISISCISHHVVGDESTIVGFINSWALLNKNEGNDDHDDKFIVPFYDRSIVKDPYGLGDCIWEETKKHKKEMMSDIIVTPPDNNNNNMVRGDEGFRVATESIGEIIYKRNNGKEYVSNGEWLKEVGGASNEGRYLAIAGSPKYDLYEADFGWGKPKKWHFVFFGSGLLMSLGKSKDSNGDLEIGLYLPKTRMNAFATIFSDGLSVL